MRSKYTSLWLSLLFLSTLVGGVFVWWLFSASKLTQVVFLNIGQGDAILISQGSNQVLIDAGRNGKDLLAHLGRHVPFWDRTIEMVIATHPDSDHIGGFPALLRTYEVERVLSTGAESETETSKLFSEAITKYVKEEETLIFSGTTLQLPEGGTFEIRYPHTPLLGVGGDTNAGSIVSRFTYGETSFLFTGDLAAEEKALSQEKKVSVLKVAHHGSKYSSSQDFLDLISPEEAVISVGKNSYGHPDQGVLERLRNIGAQIHRTDEEGDVRYRCETALQKCQFVR